MILSVFSPEHLSCVDGLLCPGLLQMVFLEQAEKSSQWPALGLCCVKAEGFYWEPSKFVQRK